MGQSVKVASGIESIKISVEKDSELRLRKALNAASKEVKRSFRKRLLAVGQIVVEEIKSRSPRGATGKLRAGTKATVPSKGLSVRVVNTATADSPRYPKYRYGKRLEFDPLYGGEYAFFYPGYEAKKAEAIDELSKVLDDIGDQFSTGGS